MRATKKSCRAKKTTSTLGRVSAVPCELGLELTQAGLGRFEGLGDPVALGADASVLFALVALAVASLLGFVFPLISTVFDFGELTHDACSQVNPDGPRPWGGVEVGLADEPIG